MRRLIRDAYAVDPLITQRKILDFVEKRSGRRLSFEYLGYLLKKVKGEMKREDVDPEKINKRLREMRETFRLARENLIQLAYNPVVSPKERINAWRTIGMLGKILLEEEMDLGVFTRKIGEVAVDHRLKPVDEETMAAISSAFESWFAAPVEMRKIVPIVKEPPKQIHAEPKPTAVAFRPAVHTVTGAGMVETE